MESAEGFTDLVLSEGFEDYENGTIPENAIALVKSRDAAIRAECTRKWISTKERLPEDGQRCLVSVYGFSCPTPYTADFIKRKVGGAFVPIYDDITAEHPMSMSQYSISMAEFDLQPSYWMPLPEPPKGEL